MNSTERSAYSVQGVVLAQLQILIGRQFKQYAYARQGVRK